MSGHAAAGYRRGLEFKDVSKVKYEDLLDIMKRIPETNPRFSDSWLYQTREERCLCCRSRSILKTQKYNPHPMGEYKGHQSGYTVCEGSPGTRGIRCVRCGNTICEACAVAILKVTKKYIATDRWCYSMYKFLKDGNMGSLEREYHCHACELEPYRDIARAKGTRLKEVCAKPARYGGYIHFYQFDLIVSPPLDKYVDIHGCGKVNDDSHGNFGAYHAVIDHELGAECFDSSFTAKSIDEIHSESTFLRNVVIPGVHPRVKNQVFNVRYVEIEQKREFPLERKADRVTFTDLAECAEISGMYGDEDVLVIIGVYTKRSNLHPRRKSTILLVRFSDHIQELPSSIIPTLHTKLMSLTKKNN